MQTISEKELKGSLPNLLYKTSIIMILKTGKDFRRKAQNNMCLMNIDANKCPYQNIIKQNPAIYKYIYT